MWPDIQNMRALHHKNSPLPAAHPRQWRESIPKWNCWRAKSLLPRKIFCAVLRKMGKGGNSCWCGILFNIFSSPPSISGEIYLIKWYIYRCLCPVMFSNIHTVGCERKNDISIANRIILSFTIFYSSERVKPASRDPFLTCSSCII